VIVWPWVYIAYRRVLTNLRAKYSGHEVQKIWGVEKGRGGWPDRALPFLCSCCFPAVDAQGAPKHTCTEKV